MRAIWIDPVQRLLLEVSVPPGDGHLECLREFLGCQWVDRVPLGPITDLWIDDEGRLTYPHPNGYFALAGTTFCGRGLILDHDTSGNSRSTRLSVEAVREHVRWIDTPPREDVEPSIMITEWSDDGSAS